MRFKIVFLLLLALLMAGAGWANPEHYLQMIEKYGPVPDAILDPPGAEEINRARRSLLSSLFGSSRARPQARTKACYANQRVTMGALEMYNMDNSTFLKSLDNDDVTDPSRPLISGKYLRGSIVKSEPQCYLRNYGDLSQEGIIYCEYHGTIPDDMEGLRIAAGYTPKARKAAEDNNMLPVFIILAVLSAGLMIVLHKVLPKAPNS